MIRWIVEPPITTRVTKLGVGVLGFGFAFLCLKASAEAAVLEDDCEPCHVTESFLVELPFIQEKGTFLAEVSSEYGSGRGEKTLSFPVSLEYGISDAWQTEIEWDAFQYSKEKGESGIQDIGEVALSVRHSFAMKDSRNHLSANLEIHFPTGKLSGNSIGYRPSVMYARVIPSCHNLHLFSQLALDFAQKIRNTDGDPGAHEFFWGGGALLPLNHFCASAEFTWTNNRWNHGGTVNEIYAAPGITWKISDAWQLGAAVPIGLNSRSDHFQVIGRVMFEF